MICYTFDHKKRLRRKWCYLFYGFSIKKITVDAPLVVKQIHFHMKKRTRPENNLLNRKKLKSGFGVIQGLLYLLNMTAGPGTPLRRIPRNV